MKKTQKIGLLLLLLCAVAVFAVACKADPKPVGPTSYTISFYSDDQLTDTLQTVGGESLTLPVPAEKEHFRFDGWFFDKGTWQDQLTADTYSDKILSGNQTVYAKWTQTEFNVTFEENGGSSVADGWFASVESSPASSKDHFRFDGWFTSPDFSGNAVTFPYTPAKDVTLYAKWTQTEFNVTFEENGGSPVADGWFASVASSPDTSKDHFRFDGWFTSPDFSDNAVTFPYTPAKDVTLYAKWTQTEFNVTFEENGGTTVADGWFEKIESKPVTEMSGFVFRGWYTSPDCTGSAVTFPYTLTEDTTLYAGWQKVLSASLVSVDGFSIQGTQVSKDSAVLPNVDSIDFNTLNVQVSEGAQWALYEDESCTRPISENVVTLEMGANLFYLKVTTPTNSAVYTVTVEKADGYALEVYENGVLKKTIVANKGDQFEKPVPVYDETLYEFDGDVYTDREMTTPFTDYTANANKKIYFKIYYIGVSFSSAINTVDGAIPTNDAEIYLKIPSEINGVPVLTIDSHFRNDFSFKKNLLEIYISDGVQEIENSTFYQSSKLRKVRLPDGIFLHGGVFNSCPLLTQVECGGIIRSFDTNFNSTGISNDESNYVNGAYYVGTYLAGIDKTKVVSGEFRVKEGTRSISGYAFSNLEFSGKQITSVDLGNTVEYIGAYAFSGLKALTTFTNASALRDTGKNAVSNTGFYNSSSGWENGLLYLGKCLLSAKSDLSGDVTIKNGTTNIASAVFKDLKGITSVTFPDTLESIGNEAFCIGNPTSDTPVLKALHFPASLKSIGEYAFKNQVAVEEITFAEGLETIGYSAFSGCKKAGNIVLPSSVKTIDSLALSCGPDCKIFFTGDPSLVKRIGYWNGLGVSLTPYYEYSAEKPASSGNYWHYDNGLPVVWEL